MEIPEYVLDALATRVRELVDLMIEDPTNCCATAKLLGPSGSLTFFVTDELTANLFFAVLESEAVRSYTVGGTISKPN